MDAQWAGPAAAGNLPAPLTRFVGRPRESPVRSPYESCFVFFMRLLDVLGERG
jgi:hypothetical protein